MLKELDVKKLPEPVYYVESPDDRTVLVGIGVTIFDEEFRGEKVTRISWYDTTRERNMLAEEVKFEGKDLVFRRVKREGGGAYRLMPMNLEIYNEKVKGFLMAGEEFEGDEGVTRAFLATMRGEE